MFLEKSGDELLDLQDLVIGYSDYFNGSPRYLQLVMPLRHLVTFLRTQEATIAQWMRLCLPSCGPGFNPRALNLRIFKLYLNSDEKRSKINKKRQKTMLRTFSRRIGQISNSYRDPLSSLLPQVYVNVIPKFTFLTNSLLIHQNLIGIRTNQIQQKDFG